MADHRRCRSRFCSPAFDTVPPNFDHLVKFLAEQLCSVKNWTTPQNDWVWGSSTNKSAESEKSNPQQDTVLETGPQKPERTNIMTLSRQNVLAHTMTLVPHARHGKNLERAFSSFLSSHSGWLKLNAWRPKMSAGRLNFNAVGPPRSKINAG